MKEFSKYVLYFGIVSLSICCIVIFYYAIASVPSGDIYFFIFCMFCWPLIVIINIELIFRLYKYDRKKNPLKNKKALKILRFILYPLGASVTFVYPIRTLSYAMMFYVFFPYLPGFLFVLVAGILIMCVYILNRIKKFHKILSPDPPVEDPDSQWITI